ncbi:MAG TPA: TlpA disulfide reductase family protein [Prosthecobacter sp.]|nr:TlpA disulfide reductase family protein [Prosthecobacter sp.]HRK13275.1 TlpA disulfide reductase family protein [Prosthecobacter sp.]
MKTRPALLTALVLLTLPLTAQDAPDPRAMMQRMFNPQATKEELLEALKEAGRAGLSRQKVIEAKLIWGLRRQDADWLVRMLPELEILAKNFDPQDSAGLKSADDVRGFMEYAKALQALEKKDDAAFKTHILEAAWSAPGQAQLFFQLVEKTRREAKMANLKMDLGLVLTTSSGEATTLKDQLAGKKALLIDFWASWCGPCMQLMPALKKKAAELAPHGIVVMGMNKDDENAESVAEKIRDEQGIEFPWLVEPRERPFTQLLEIESIPRMVLVAPDGAILFNGHPQDPALYDALQKLDPAVKKPEA